MNLHKWTVNECEQMRRDIARLERDDKKCHDIAAIMRAHSLPEENGAVQSSGCIAICLYPDAIAEAAPFLRDMREYLGVKLEAELSPDEQIIRYHAGGVLIVIRLTKKCTFKKVGEETVIKPIYEITCE